MIKTYRRLWDNENMPFIIVQLPALGSPPSRPEESYWAEIREAQMMAEELSGVITVQTLDGKDFDLHPKNKAYIAERISLVARAMNGENDLIFKSPRYKSMRIENDKIIISFSDMESGLACKGERLKGFTIAGKNQKFVSANAEIKGDKVVVWSDEVKDPIAVRYAWADNPDGCNLYNEHGLPVSSFRTDDWKIKSQNTVYY
jgi:sialate O-acetylesterase